MSKTFHFIFSGTKEDFFDRVKQFAADDHKAPALADVIIDISEDSCRFGVGRGAHYGGYYFVPTFAEEGDQLLISGKIQYIDSREKRPVEVWWEKVEEIVGVIILLPVILLVKIYQLIRLLISKCTGRPIQNIHTDEERLFLLMKDGLGCVKVVKNRPR